MNVYESVMECSKALNATSPGSQVRGRWEMTIGAWRAYSRGLNMAGFGAYQEKPEPGIFIVRFPLVIIAGQAVEYRLIVEGEKFTPPTPLPFYKA